MLVDSFLHTMPPYRQLYTLLKFDTQVNNFYFLSFCSWFLWRIISWASSCQAFLLSFTVSARLILEWANFYFSLYYTWIHWSIIMHATSCFSFILSPLTHIFIHSSRFILKWTNFYFLSYCTWFLWRKISWASSLQAFLLTASHSLQRVILKWAIFDFSLYYTWINWSLILHASSCFSFILSPPTHIFTHCSSLILQWTTFIVCRIVLGFFGVAQESVALLSW